MDGSVKPREERTYGNWLKPRAPGIGFLGVLPSMILMVGVIVTFMLTLFVGMAAAFVSLLVVLLIVLVLSVRDRHGLSLMERWSEMWAWRKRKSRGEHVFTTGISGRAGDGALVLPGLLADTDIAEGVDVYGRAFGVVCWEKLGLYSVVFMSEPEGDTLPDVDALDRRVAIFGQWIASLGLDQSVVQAQVIVENVPDNGERLSRNIHANVKDGIPDLAAQMMREVEELYPVDGSLIRSYMTVTFSSERPGGGKRRSRSEMLTDLAVRMGGFAQGLAGTGAGAVRPLDKAGIVRAVRTAYVPGDESVFDAHELVGEQLDVEWSEAGPQHTVASKDLYEHDGVFSRSWVMTKAPEGLVVASTLKRLVSPDPDIAVKRVCLIYRPDTVGEASRIAVQDAKNASARAGSSSRPGARTTLEAKKAAQTEQEEAQGAGLTRFGMTITATAFDPADVPLTMSHVEDLAGTARIAIRPAYGLQDSAFIAGLPVGLVASRFAGVADATRGLM
ncbi:MAG: hypothetical protein IKZ87_01535 [Actinomycetaceae bacterium]|nr:hypothetical protein [Actinomycetaceae bacterium]